MLGGVGMWYLIDCIVFDVFGFGGFFVNVLCGSVVDIVVLVDVLCEWCIVGVGFDVYEGELELLCVLMDFDSVVFMLYMGGWLFEVFDCLVW